MARLFAIISVALLVAHATALVKQPCSRVEDYRVPDGRDYRGFVNTTISGIQCQAWAAQTPRTHTVPIDPSIGTAGAGNNYCRNPSGQSTGPGCLTMTGPNVFELCNVGPVCVVGNVQAVADVVISPVDARQTTPFYVSLNTSTPNAFIYYTTDGTDPVEVDGAAYTAPFVLVGSGPVVVKAFAVRDYWNPSRISFRQYSLTQGPVAPVNVIPVPQSGTVYYHPVFVTLSNSDPTVSAPLIYYTTDGSSPDVTSTQYTGPFWIKTSCTIRALAVASGRSPSNPTYVQYTINAPQAPTPLVSPVINDPTAVVWGAFSALILSELANPEFQVSINGTKPVSLAVAQAMLSSIPTDPFTIRVDVVGLIKLDIFVSDINTRNSAAITLQFNVVPIPLTTILPPPGTYYGPTEIVAGFATGGNVNGLPLVMSVNGQRALGRLVLSTLGTFTVETYGKTIAAEGQHTIVNYTLSPIQLYSPQMKPNPSSGFPSGFLFASPLQVNFPVATTDGVAYIVTVTSLTRGTLTSQQLAASNTYASIQLVVSTGLVTETFKVAVRAVPADSSNPFLIPSVETYQVFNVAAPSNRATPYFRITPLSSPITQDCAILLATLNTALFLSGGASGAQVQLTGCGGRPAFRIINLSPPAVDGYTRFIINDLSAPSTSTIYAALGGAVNGTASVTFMDTPFFESRCVTVPATYFPQNASVLASALTAGTVPLTPAQCAAQCAADSTATGFAIAAGGAGCACINPQSATLPSLESTGQCTFTCLLDSTRYCGGALSGASIAASVYSLVSVGTQVSMFTMVYSYLIATPGQLMTTSRFSIQLQASNLPATGGTVRYILPGMDCNSLYATVPFDSTGLSVSGVLAKEGSYSVCVALSTNDGVDLANVFRLVGRVDGVATGGVVVTLGENIPVLIDPATGTYAAPLTVTVTTPTAGATLSVTIDQNAPLAVSNNKYTFVLTDLGSHLVTANALNGPNSIGLAAARSYKLVAPGTLTSAPSTNASSGGAAAIGVLGYQFQLTTSRTITVILTVNQSAWKGCGGSAPTTVADDCVVFLLAPGSTDCTYPGTQSPRQASLLIRYNAGSFMFQTVNNLDVTGYPMSRLPLSVCIAPLPATSANSTSGYIVSAIGTPLTAAEAGRGTCSAQQQSMCQAQSTCAARFGVQVDVFNPTAKVDQLVCLCNPPADYTSLTVFCTTPALTPTELVTALVWNGTVFALPGAATPAPTAAPSAQQGSVLTLLFLIALFAGSTAVLIYWKRLPEPA